MSKELLLNIIKEKIELLEEFCSNADKQIEFWKSLEDANTIKFQMHDEGKKFAYHLAAGMFEDLLGMVERCEEIK